LDSILASMILVCRLSLSSIYVRRLQTPLFTVSTTDFIISAMSPTPLSTDNTTEFILFYLLSYVTTLTVSLTTSFNCITVYLYPRLLSDKFFFILDNILDVFITVPNYLEIIILCLCQCYYIRLECSLEYL